MPSAAMNRTGHKVKLYLRTISQPVLLQHGSARASCLHYCPRLLTTHWLSWRRLLRGCDETVWEM